jgi:hypothetical protein
MDDCKTTSPGLTANEDSKVVAPRPSPALEMQLTEDKKACHFTFHPPPPKSWPALEKVSESKIFWELEAAVPLPHNRTCKFSSNMPELFIRLDPAPLWVKATAVSLPHGPVVQVTFSSKRLLLGDNISSCKLCMYRSASRTVRSRNRVPSKKTRPKTRRLRAPQQMTVSIWRPKRGSTRSRRCVCVLSLLINIVLLLLASKLADHMTTDQLTDLIISNDFETSFFCTFQFDSVHSRHRNRGLNRYSHSRLRTSCKYSLWMRCLSYELARKDMSCVYVFGTITRSTLGFPDATAVYTQTMCR